jgi:hypothetical protein
MAAPHNILLLAFPNGQLLDIAGPLQMFAGANDELPRPVYRIAIAAPQAGHFATSAGVRLVADLSFAQVTNRRLERTDTLITVGIALVLGAIGLVYAWPIESLVPILDPVTDLLANVGLTMDRELGYLCLFACPSLLVVGSLLPGI